MMENEDGELLASISIDADEAVDGTENAGIRRCFQGAELARLCIRKEYSRIKNWQGIWGWDDWRMP